MIHFNLNAEIARSLKQVFRFVTAPENDFRWQYGTFASARIPQRIGATGAFFRSIGHLVGRRNLSTFEVTEFEPNKKYGFKSLSGLLDVQTTYSLERVGGGTKITISIRANALHFDPVEQSFLEKSMKEQLKENLERLKALLESRHTMLHSEPVYLPGA